MRIAVYNAPMRDLSTPPRDFVALDFETANYRAHSACEIGLVRVENGIVIEERSFLVRPPDRWFVPRFSEMHGLSWPDVAEAPDWDELWGEIAAMIEPV